VTDSDNQAAAAERKAALDRALDGGLDELPPNQVKGLLGERMPDLRKEEDFTPDLNAGISQEMDFPVMWMGIVPALILFFPLGHYLPLPSESHPFPPKVTPPVPPPLPPPPVRLSARFAGR